MEGSGTLTRGRVTPYRHKRLGTQVMSDSEKDDSGSGVDPYVIGATFLGGAAGLAAGGPAGALGGAALAAGATKAIRDRQSGNSADE